MVGNGRAGNGALESGGLISTFGEDEAGNVYVADHRGGKIYKVVVP